MSGGELTKCFALLYFVGGGCGGGGGGCNGLGGGYGVLNKAV